MLFDIEDVLSGAIGRVFLLFVFLISATWLGSFIGGLALSFRHWDLLSGYVSFELSLLWESPGLLLNVWIVPNVGLLAMAAVYLMVTDGFGYAAWGIIVAVESLFAMLDRCMSFYNMTEAVVSWSSWLVLVVMAETGVCLVRNWKRNQWAREMMELSAENAMRRAERVANSPGTDKPDFPEDDDLELPHRADRDA